MAKALLRIFALLAAVLLTACESERHNLTIGGKDFGESMILSEMIAALAEDAGIPVTRRIGLGPTLENLESLRRGEIDIYVEYTGTGLVMVGEAALADGDAAMARVSELFAPFDLTWGPRLGFANNYGLAMREARAAEMGVRRVSDLAPMAEDMTIGINEDFLERPLDGFTALTRRYGMGFGDVVVVPIEERPTLYDQLLAAEVDVTEVFTTDGQIADLDLRLLEDDLAFFPAYEAAPLVHDEALARFPALGGVLERLAGRVDEEMMRILNLRVDQEGLAPRAVALSALAELGLVDDGELLEIAAPLVVAFDPSAVAEPEEGRALRAIRQAFPNRRVAAQPIADPLAAVGAGTARLALVPAVGFVEVDGRGVGLNRPFEAVGVVGQTFAHLIALEPTSDLGAIRALSTGPHGSTSHRAGRILAAGLEGDIELVAGGGPADATVVVAPLGAPAVIELIEAGGRLIPLTSWAEGGNLVRFPHLRQARIPAETYAGQAEAIETLSSQLVLAAPRRVEERAVGQAGPGAGAPRPISPLPDETVARLNEALRSDVGVDPALPQARVLTPALPEPAPGISPSPAVSALSVGVFLMLGWLLWLYARPERR
jgi:glycine betaine/choline ABC-type transport system substrate-binding protein